MVAVVDEQSITLSFSARLYNDLMGSEDKEMLLQVEKYIGHGKTTSWFINPDHIISFSPGQNNHTVDVLTTDLKTVEVAGKLEELVMAFNRATKC